MSIRQKIVIVPAVMLAMLVLALTNQAHAQTVTPPSIAEIASSGGFTTLVAALTEAGLVPTFADCSSGQTYTVFAPTEEAFADLPTGTLDIVLADNNLLTNILTYHVISGTVGSAAVVTLDSATTLQGSDISIDVGKGVVLNDTVNVTAVDIAACNGVIHIIDGVLMPPDPTAVSLSSQDVLPAYTGILVLTAALLGASIAAPSIIRRRV